jgi:radical SAM protein with 4Fe4S-binding SPASM domain
MDKPVLGSLKLALGYDCNLKCGFCLQQNADKSPKLDFADVQKIMQEDMVKSDVKRITITGGEPTHEPYIDTAATIVELASRMGKETCIFTNGVLLDDDMLGMFKYMGLTRFRVSLYDPIDWKWVRDLMKRLKAHDFPRMAKYTVTKETIGNIDEVLHNVANKTGIEWFQVKPYNRIEVPEVDAQYELEPDQVFELSAKLLKFKMEEPQIKVDLLPLCYEFLVDNTIKAEDISPCNCGQGKEGYLVVTPTGDVKICGAYPVALGNIKTDTITDIWENHHLLKEVRTRTQPEQCKDCDHWEKCKKNDCHSATYAMHGDFKHGNPQCPIIKKKYAKYAGKITNLTHDEWDDKLERMGKT